MTTITSHLQTITKNIEAAAKKADRNPDTVHLLAVSKTRPPEDILEAAEAGQLAFGENYEQEAVGKIEAIKKSRPDLKLEWHFIGPIQSNKTRSIAEHFDWVHSVDREKIARRLSEQRPDHLGPLNICLQINISNEKTKSGILPEDMLKLAESISAMPNLRLRGLMAIPEPESDPARQRQPFAAMKALFDQLVQAGYNVDTLSMGMSDDMETAIQEGATTVRIGTAIFGKRNYPDKK